MFLVAHIIVDVPLMQTDRPYSYLVPEAMQETNRHRYAGSCAFW